MRELWHHFDLKYNEIDISECGIQQFKPNEGYQYMAYQNFVVHYINKGQGTYLVDGKRYFLKQGQGFIIRRGMNVKYEANPEKPWQNFWVGLSGSQLKNHLDNSLLFEKDILNFNSGSNAVKTIKNICLKTLEIEPNYLDDSWYLAKVYELIYNLCDEFPNNDIHTIKNINNNNYAQIAFEFIYSNFKFSITIQEIADYIGIDRSYLYRLFKEKYNISPHECLINIRIHQAKQDLLNTDKAVNVIANDVGYNDALQFSKSFKNKIGLSPYNFRKKYKNNKDV